MSSGGQQPVTQQTQQTRDPWSQAQPHLITAMGSAQANYQGDVGYQPWTGATQAPLNNTLSGTIGALEGQLTPEMLAGGTAGVNAGRALGTSLIEHQGLNSELRSLYEQSLGNENPFLQDIINASNRRISDKVGSSMSGAGRYGSGQHTDVATRAMAEAADPIYAQDYARRQQQAQSILEGGLQRAGQWSQLMPSLDEARYAPADRLMALGQFQQERSQDELSDQIKLWDAQQARPWENLARYNAIVGGAGGLGGTVAGTTSTPINSPSTLQKILGGGLAGAGIGGSFGGPLGAGVGGAAGGLLSLL